MQHFILKKMHLSVRTCFRTYIIIIDLLSCIHGNRHPIMLFQVAMRRLSSIRPDDHLPEHNIAAAVAVDINMLMTFI